MTSPEFCQKVKQNVTANFDESLDQYQAFEERHHLFANLAAALAERIRLRPGATVLDVGCGNGISSRVLHERYGCRVVGVDLSPKMVDDGRQRLRDVADVCLLVGDGDRLVEATGNERFDYALYNASIFIFPDVAQTIRSAAGCLKPGGEIAFSFYPSISGPDGEDLIGQAFGRIGLAPPRSRVITEYDAACRALESQCGTLRHHQWTQPLDMAFLKDFFSIPAQSASLFPGKPYDARRSMVVQLFDAVADSAGGGTIAWPMAQGRITR